MTLRARLQQWRTVPWLITTAVLFVFGCEHGEVVATYTPYAVYPTPTYPPNNLPTAERIALGALLFNDKRLSADSSISCSSCHRETNAFADSVPFSIGVYNRIGSSNAPSILYAGFETSLLRGRTVPSLEMQVLVPIQEHAEFATNIVRLVELLANDTTYQRLSATAYQRHFDAWVLTRSIASFVRSLPRFTSRFDDAVRANTFTSFTVAELRGYQVFTGSGRCGSCHGGLLFTTHGLVTIADELSKPDPEQQRHPNGIKVPSLRNVALTAPYLHDGSVPSIHDVLTGYQHKTFVHTRTDRRLQGMEISANDVEDLEAFLNTLTDR